MLLILRYLLVAKLSANETFEGENGVGWVHDSLTLRWQTN